MTHKLVLVQSEINKMRAAYGRCPTSSHKQIGLRRLRDAEYFMGRNSDYAIQQLASARHHLPYAEAWRD